MEDCWGNGVRWQLSEVSRGGVKGGNRYGFGWSRSPLSADPLAAAMGLVGGKFRFDSSSNIL